MNEPEQQPFPLETFYAGVPDLLDFHQIADPTQYTDVPNNWWIALTDVCGSTKAIEAGRYRDVNAVGVASIIGMLNAMRDVELPYVFGGDGATMLVPGSRRVAAEQALRGVKSLAQEAFDLELRCGLVPVASLREAGHFARVAAFRSSPHLRLAMLSGSAFPEAERWVKSPTTRDQFEVKAEGSQSLDFEGFECRWRPIPAVRGSMVSLLILAQGKTEVERADIYACVLGDLEVMIETTQSHPLKGKHMRFKGMFDDFSVEARIRGGAARGGSVQVALAEAKKRTLIARALGMLRKSAGGYDPQRYKNELIENTDFRKFDEMLRMVVDLTAEEYRLILTYLETKRSEGKICFGTHQSSSALMTCLVRSFAGAHVHFVDGADGGYALAAKQLKAQLNG